MTLSRRQPLADRSVYASVFRDLHRRKNWGVWVEIDSVSGGGLASRLRERQYRGMQDLDYVVMTNTERDEQDRLRHRVFVKVLGLSEP